MADLMDVAEDAAEQALNAVGRISLESARMRSDVEDGKQDGMHLWKIGADLEQFAVSAARHIEVASTHMRMVSVEYKKAGRRTAAKAFGRRKARHASESGGRTVETFRLRLVAR